MKGVRSSAVAARLCGTGIRAGRCQGRPRLPPTPTDTTTLPAPTNTTTLRRLVELAAAALRYHLATTDDFSPTMCHNAWRDLAPVLTVLGLLTSPALPLLRTLG